MHSMIILIFSVNLNNIQVASNLVTHFFLHLSVFSSMDIAVIPQSVTPRPTGQPSNTSSQVCLFLRYTQCQE